jgi:hypothetical protein
VRRLRRSQGEVTRKQFRLISLAIAGGLLMAARGVHGDGSEIMEMIAQADIGGLLLWEAVRG